jgi:NADH pyrophosphatase NudC (nudix superfamily)
MMQQNPSPEARGPMAAPSQVASPDALTSCAPSRREQPCPQCGYPMSDLKGGREAICQNCGFKDSCCY